MTKKELIKRICTLSHYDVEDLSDYSKEELEELLEEFTDYSDLFPNGRDYDAEDEDY